MLATLSISQNEALKAGFGAAWAEHGPCDVLRCPLQRTVGENLLQLQSRRPMEAVQSGEQRKRVCFLHPKTEPRKTPMTRANQSEKTLPHLALLLFRGVSVEFGPLERLPQKG